MTKVTNISVLPDATQNFVEVYKRRRRDAKFGSLEKKLIAAVCVLTAFFCIFFILFILVENDYNQLAKEKICTSKECIESAMTLLQTVDFSQDPCEDFYKFACGNFKNDHPITENYLHNSWFVEKENRLSRLVLDILKSPILPSDLKSVRQTKLFYQACTNKSELNRLGLQPLYRILEILELPKSVPSNKTIENFNLGRTLALAQRYLSQDILVSVSFSPGIANSSEDISAKNTTFLKIGPGLNGLGVFDIWKPNHDIFSRRKMFKFRRKIDSDEKDWHPASKDKKLSRQVIMATIKFISAIINEINNDLEVEPTYTNDYNASYHVATAYKIMTFTSQLIEDMENNDNNTQNRINLEQTTFAALQITLDEESANDLLSNRIDWKEYTSILFQNLNMTYDVESESIIVENMEYFKHISRVLGEAKPETIQRHIWWKIVEQYAVHTTSDIRAIYFRYYQTIYGEGASTPRNHACTNLMKNMMNVALSYEMSRINNFSTTFHKVHEMLKDIEMVFESLVKSLSWMDSKTKSVTLDKAKSVSNEIGYANWITDPIKVNQYYSGLELLKSDFLMNLLRVSEWEVEKALQILVPNKDNSTRYTDSFINPLQVNAYYSRQENAIIIPAGILQAPFYFRGLESLNYGAIGTILGHELTHGFDIEGKNYNKMGMRQDNWWPDNIVAEYETRAKCFVKQYGNYTIYENNKLNGSLTLAENIADNGGIRESYKAYKLYISRNGAEPKLPGFENFTHEQLLFLSYANIWCETSIPKYYILSQDSHSPHRVRVVASLQNMKEFSEAYKCSAKSFMNPTDKCVIW